MVLLESFFKSLILMCGSKHILLLSWSFASNLVLDALSVSGC